MEKKSEKENQLFAEKERRWNEIADDIEEYFLLEEIHAQKFLLDCLKQKIKNNLEITYD